MTPDDFLHGLLDYPALPSEAHRALAAYAGVHPSVRALHDAVADLPPGASVDEARDAVLAQYAATRRLPHPAPPPLDAVFARLRRVLVEDPALGARCASLARRLADLDAATASGLDAEARFAALTRRPPTAPPDSEPGGDGAPPASPPVREPARRYAQRYARRFALGAAAAAACYGLLAGAAVLTRSDLDRLAALPPGTLATDAFSLRTRGEAADIRAPEAHYLEALVLLREARRRPLGLFTYYREAPRAAAVRALEAAVAAAEDAGHGFVRGESLLLLARLRIAERDLDGARALLQRVPPDAEPHAAEARRLLNALDDAAD